VRHQGAWYRGWRLVSLDVADTTENGASFGCPGANRGESAFPQLRFVALLENGTHVLFGARLGGDGQGSTGANPWNTIGGGTTDDETTLPSVALPPAMPVEPSATPPMTWR